MRTTSAQNRSRLNKSGLATSTLAMSAAAAFALTTLVTAPAHAAPSCIAQSATDFAPGDLGPTLSSYARNYKPLGQIIAYEATSPKDNCPPE